MFIEATIITSRLNLLREPGMASETFLCSPACSQVVVEGDKKSCGTGDFECVSVAGKLFLIIRQQTVVKVPSTFVELALIIN